LLFPQVHRYRDGALDFYASFSESSQLHEQVSANSLSRTITIFPVSVLGRTPIPQVPRPTFRVMS
jgi:hypothetical protein